ncbi:MAG: aminoacyl-tRNA hydrolase [Gammaproteobacteria bacterium]
MNGIRLIVGLGNPGSEHRYDRHNAGFWFVDAVARAHGVSLARESKFFGEVAKATIAGRPVWLLQPQTWMNRSGQAVAALTNFYRIEHDEILVAHDELDLMPGQLKIKKGGGTAGHNGLKSLAAQLGGPGFWRLRLGIGHPRTLGLNQAVVDFVLHRPGLEHLELIGTEIGRAVACVPELVRGEFEAATMKLHTRGSPAS